MITRRHFLASGVAAASLPAFGRSAFAQSPTQLRFGPTTTDISAGHAAHSSLPNALGYWEQEGLSVDIFGVAGPVPGLQLITTGQMEFLTITAEELIYARQNGMAVKSGYMHAREPISRFVTLKSEGVTDLSVLKGTTLGTPQLQTNALAAGLLAEAGVNMESDVEMVATGTGAPAALALRRGDISGWVSWDTAVAGLENLGLEFDYHYPEYYDLLLGNFIVGEEERINANPEVYIGLCRGVAKAAHFGLTNPEAAIRLHWEAYPQTRPQDGDTPEAMEAAKRVFLARFNSFALQDGVLRYGDARDDQWTRVVQQMADIGTIEADYDATSAFDSAFLEEINDFDREEIEEQARTWSM